jgi:negative regulator of sigma-B (phosphoserine phosphatase)
VVAAVGASALAEWGVATRPIPGETVSGDRHVAVALPSWLLFAVVDGLGHGAEAARASSKAAQVLEADPGSRPEDLIRLCHEALRRTRGAAMTIACVDTAADELVWLGVGNVQAALLQPEGVGVRARQWAPLRGGVVGYVLPSLRPSTAPVQRDDVLVLATDGVRPVFSGWPAPSEAPEDVAARILDEQGRGSDDALVLVARYRGGGPAVNAR